MKLTPRQTEVHQYMKAFVKEHKVYAQIKDIMEHFGITRQAVVIHLNDLIKKGAVNKARVGVYVPK